MKRMARWTVLPFLMLGQTTAIGRAGSFTADRSWSMTSTPATPSTAPSPPPYQNLHPGASQHFQPHLHGPRLVSSPHHETMSHEATPFLAQVLAIGFTSVVVARRLTSPSPVRNQNLEEKHHENEKANSPPGRADREPHPPERRGTRYHLRRHRHRDHGNRVFVSVERGRSPIRTAKSSLRAQSRGSGGIDHFTIARYNTNGSLDSTFGSGGVAVIPLSTNPVQNAGDGAFAVAIQPDGKILAAGYDDGAAVKIKGSSSFTTTGQSSASTPTERWTILSAAATVT